MSQFNIREVKEDDLDRCFVIESDAYSGDEAATKEKILKRIKQYPEGFIVIENDQQVVGFINSGATDHVVLSDENFKELVGHDSSGKQIVIMSVVTHPEYQGLGLVNQLMSHFVDKMREHNKTDIFLICQTELIDMYRKYGFKLLGLSKSEHGGLSWHEMSMAL